MRVTVVHGFVFDRRVCDLRLSQRHFGHGGFDLFGSLGGRQFSLRGFQHFQQPIGLGVLWFDVLGHGLLPAIGAGDVPPVPLRLDEMQLADLAAADHLHSFEIADVVMPLVASGQIQPLAMLPRAIGHPGHRLASAHGMTHQLLGHHVQTGVHGHDGRRGVQVQRQGDDHRLDAILFRVADKLFVAAIVVVVHLDMFARLVFALPAVNFQQPRPGIHAYFPVEGPIDTERADVGDRADFDELGIDSPDEHAPFVAGAQHTNANRLAQRCAVAEVERAEASAGDCSGGNCALDEIAARDIIAWPELLRSAHNLPILALALFFSTVFRDA
jgi:hypothetical protein